MNMKKALAGLSAGLVAVSAMATTAFAEETNINLFAWDYQTNTYTTSVNVYGDYGYLNNGDRLEFAIVYSDAKTGFDDPNNNIGANPADTVADEFTYNDSHAEISAVKVNGYTAYPYAVQYHEVNDEGEYVYKLSGNKYVPSIKTVKAVPYGNPFTNDQVRVVYYVVNVGAFGSNALENWSGYVENAWDAVTIPAGRYEKLDLTIACKEGDVYNKNELTVNQYWGDATRVYFRTDRIANTGYAKPGDFIENGANLANIWGNENASNWVLNLVKETSARTNIAWDSLTSYDMTVANTNALKAAKTAKLVLTLNADVKDALAKVKVTSVWNNANDYQDGDVNWNIASETTAYAVGAIGNTLTIELPVEAVYSAAYDKVVEALKFEVIDTSADFGAGTANDIKRANIVSAVITVSNDESEEIDVEEPIEPKPDDEDEITVDDDKTDTEEPADTNPGTGAAIALVPVVLAAAAAVVAKRK